jgi:hypothetical protein
LETTTISGLPGTFYPGELLYSPPSFAEDVELNFAKTAGKGHLLPGRDVLIAEEDYGVIIVSALDGGERLVVEPDVTGSGAIDTNKDIAECHCPSPGLGRQRYAWETPAETTRSPNRL